jgi:integral membrane sensor domain MASE1
MEDVSVDLRYRHELVASYRFSELASANEFIVKAKLLADSLTQSAVTCSVTISAVTVEETPSQLGKSLSDAMVASREILT